MPLKKKNELPDEMDYLDCFTEAEEIRLIRTAIEQNLDIIGTGPVTKGQDAALYTIKLLCSALDTAADILDEIGRRDTDD
jgi:hypothetical protein